MKYLLDGIPIYAICFDLDGTILNSEKEISVELIEWLIEYQKNEGIVLLASGRKKREMDNFTHELRMPDFNSGYIISSNGMYLEKIDGKIKHCFPTFTIEKRDEIVGKLLKEFSFCTIVTPNIDYICIRRYTVITLLKQILFYIRKIPVKYIISTELYKLPEHIEKIFVKGKLNHEFFKQISDIHWFVIDGEQTDILPENVDKMYAITKGIECSNINEKNVLVFGDDENDMMTFLKLQNTVAMKNGVTELKKEAKYISCKTNDENGVFDFLTRRIYIN